MAKRRSRFGKARRRSRSGGGGFLSGRKKVSIGVVGGLAMGLYDPLKWAVAGAPAQGPEGWLDKLLRNYTGFTPSRAYYGRAWDARFLVYGLLPLVGGALLHRLANRLGINAALRAIPFIEI